MAKKEESALALAPITQESGLGIQEYSNSFSPIRPQNRDEQWVHDEFRIQAQVMKGTEAKTKIAMYLTAEVEKHGAVLFDDTVGFLLAIKGEPHGKEHQVYIDEFTTRSIQMLGKYILGLEEVAAVNIGMEVHRSLYPPEWPEPEPEPEPPSLWKRLFG